MKNAGLFLFLASGFLITSCCTHQSLVKRHYNKGYYVDHVASVSKTPANDAPSVSATTPLPVTEQVMEMKRTEPKHSIPVVPLTHAATAQTVKAPAIQSANKVVQNRTSQTVSNDIPALTSSGQKANETSYSLKSKRTKSKSTGGDTSAILLIILCIFLPPLAVYLKEGAITNKFWIDLLLCFLFFFPGEIFAFIVCFA